MLKLFRRRCSRIENERDYQTLRGFQSDALVDVGEILEDLYQAYVRRLPLSGSFPGHVGCDDTASMSLSVQRVDFPFEGFCMD